MAFVAAGTLWTAVVFVVAVAVPNDLGDFRKDDIVPFVPSWDEVLSSEILPKPFEEDAWPLVRPFA